MSETQQLTLTDFLLARIAEDERVHGSAKVMPMPGDEFDCPCGRRGYLGEYSTTDGCLNDPLELTHVVGHAPPAISGGWVLDDGAPVLSTHILDEDQSAAILDAMPVPASSRRVLAECEAKRRIVGLASDDTIISEISDDVLRLLALPYADHPDYRDEWRPWLG